ncbi:MAG: hypothetical protein ACRDF0_11845 [Candidatus Limnocylindria bacterium]
MSRALRFVPISEIAVSASAEPDWTWDGYLAAGTVTLLAGRPKSSSRCAACLAVFERWRREARQHDADERRAS